ncbi:MAG: rRNA processing protein RimM [Actinomycetota bacterium]|nr:rRNA processing protein RimM [Actinomycetota bacterium]
MLEVGRIAKAHGIKGEVLVDLLTDRVERVAVGSVLSTKSGQELVVTFSSSHLGKWIVRFEGVGTRTEAEALHGLVLFAEPIDDPDALFVHDLIGSTVVADGVVIGTVASVEANPASDLLVLDNGKLIPVRFVVDRSAGRLTVDLPEGLLDL